MRLNAAQHREYQTLPGGRFPMPDAEHARLALAMLSRAHGLSTQQKHTVRARAEHILHPGQPYGQGNPARRPGPALTAMQHGRTLYGHNPQDIKRGGGLVHLLTQR